VRWERTHCFVFTCVTLESHINKNVRLSQGIAILICEHWFGGIVCVHVCEFESRYWLINWFYIWTPHWYRGNIVIPVLILFWVSQKSHSLFLLEALTVKSSHRWAYLVGKSRGTSAIVWLLVLNPSIRIVLMLADKCLNVKDSSPFLINSYLY
jgi:hypothetical protein